MFKYKKRSIKEMLRGETDVVYDFTDLDYKFADGEITYQEWSETFSKMRHLISVAIGGSSVGVLFGHNQYKTPRELQLQIAFPEDDAYKEKFSQATKDAFARGHFFEDGVGRMGGYLLEQDLVSKGLAKKVEVLPFPQQCRNLAFPNCVGDFDRVVRITGGPYEGLWLGEIKTTIYNGPHAPGYWNDYFTRENLSNEDRIPPAYLDQVDFYLGILPYLKGAILFASCGFDGAKENVQIMIPRDDKRSCAVLNAAQEFCEKTKAGITVSDDVIEEPETLRKALKITHGAMDKELPPVDISQNPYMDRLVEVDQELADLKRKIKEPQEELESEASQLTVAFEAEYAEILERIEYLEKERKLIKYRLVPAIGDGTAGEAVYGDTKYHLKVSRVPSFAEKTKEYLKEKYPKVWEEISSYDPYYRVKLSISKNADTEDEPEELLEDIEF